MTGYWIYLSGLLFFYVNLSDDALSKNQDLLSDSVISFSKKQLRTLTRKELVGEKFQQITKYCILYKVEKFESDKNTRTLVYVGMTRASERLIVNYEYNRNFASEITDLLV